MYPCAGSSGSLRLLLAIIHLLGNLALALLGPYNAS